MTVTELVREARVQLRVHHDRERALELVTAADAMLADATVPAEVHASLASLWLDLGDERRSEERIRQAIEAESHPVLLGTHKLFYAKLLHAQQRHGEAARHAREGLAIYEQGVAPDYPELPRLWADLAPILRHPPGAGELRAMSERLCAVATGGKEEIRRAFGTPTIPPPLVTAGELSRASVELHFEALAPTRRELDETFGPADVLPRTGAFASHVLAYGVRVPGAPARVTLYARFATAPEPGTSPQSVLLRIDPAPG
ncbi:hypothetical protein KZZ52_25085 [Dactylosporangium sp. AC04546]|uniref:hypothetical protein n=1 Tax=Dactylosporangium sp. AC04546 TaxID=2862460 RepID=UPI001EDFF2E4|nr:hypothetical protein [Dactylosporangium sp. AC04546]WVK88546.1 hypothetical protein KZZ52_25085 [Dactylosporangium sp. AC04546]